ncbi:MAG: hypothetical protein IT425_04900 [Pirellulales bacterium]|nr:hypothetical protein [Pirellulales bacterium]
MKPFRKCRWLVLFTVMIVQPDCVRAALQIATFKVDITPPPGSPLCDALVPSSTGVNDPLSARGIVLVSPHERPIVLVALDWVGVGNEGHEVFRQSLAEACHTPIDRVCVHALHQHDAPGCDYLAERIATEAGLPNQLFPVKFSREAIARISRAAAEAMGHLQLVTHIGYGKGIVKKVASNRRILGADGKVEGVRFTATKDPKLQAAPEGTIDPYVRAISFWNDKNLLTVLTYYATHPQSYYHTRLCSADFVGMARDQAEAAEHASLHIHFNGAGGNIGSGKYNDGSHERRPILASRLAEGMKRAFDATEKLDASNLELDWATREVSLPVAEWFDETSELALLNDKSAKTLPRLRAARHIAWARRAKSGAKITLARLRLGSIDILHMPGELFVEYQLAAQAFQPKRFVCMAAYGDYGPGYIGTAIAYSQGGYETGDSHASRVSSRVEPVLLNAIQELLTTPEDSR